MPLLVLKNEMFALHITEGNIHTHSLDVIKKYYCLFFPRIVIVENDHSLIFFVIVILSFIFFIFINTILLLLLSLSYMSLLLSAYKDIR